MIGGMFRNIKTKDFYMVFYAAIDATNARDGAAVVVYRKLGSDQMFVRDLDEFREKFERVEAGK